MASESERLTIFGTPRAVVDGAPLRLQVTDDFVTTASLSIGNLADGLVVYRLEADRSWIRLSTDAGVAVGSPPGAAGGEPATVLVEADVEGLPAGIYQGTILVEALLPSGVVETTRVTVVLDKQGVPRYQAGSPQS